MSKKYSTKISFDCLQLPLSVVAKYIHIYNSVLNYAHSKNVRTLEDFINMSREDIVKTKFLNDVVYFQKYITEKSNWIYNRFMLQNINVKLKNLCSTKTSLKDLPLPKYLYHKLYRNRIISIEQVLCLTDKELKVLNFSQNEIKIIRNCSSDYVIDIEEDEKQFSDIVVICADNFINLLGNNLPIKRETVLKKINKIISNKNISNVPDLSQDVELQVNILNLFLIKNKIKRNICLFICKNKYVHINKLYDCLNTKIDKNIINGFLEELLLTSEIYIENEYYRCIKFTEYICNLTPMFQDIIKKRANKATYKEICEPLKISKATVGAYISKIFKDARKYIFYEDIFLQTYKKYKKYISIDEICENGELDYISRFYIKSKLS